MSNNVDNIRIRRGFLLTGVVENTNLQVSESATTSTMLTCDGTATFFIKDKKTWTGSEWRDFIVVDDGEDILYAGVVTSVQPSSPSEGFSTVGTVELGMYLAKRRIVPFGVKKNPLSASKFTGATTSDLVKSLIASAFSQSGIPSDAPKPPMVLGPLSITTKPATKAYSALWKDAVSYSDALKTTSRANGAFEYMLVPYFSDSEKRTVKWNVVTGSDSYPQIRYKSVEPLNIDIYSVSNLSTFDTAEGDNDYYTRWELRSKDGDEDSKTGSDQTSGYVSGTGNKVLIDRDIYKNEFELSASEMNVLNSTLRATSGAVASDATFELQEAWGERKTWIGRIGRNVVFTTKGAPLPTSVSLRIVGVRLDLATENCAVLVEVPIFERQIGKAKTEDSKEADYNFGNGGSSGGSSDGYSGGTTGNNTIPNPTDIDYGSPADFTEPVVDIGDNEATIPDGSGIGVGDWKAVETYTGIDNSTTPPSYALGGYLGRPNKSPMFPCAYKAIPGNENMFEASLYDAKREDSSTFSPIEILSGNKDKPSQIGSYRQFANDINVSDAGDGVTMISWFALEKDGARGIDQWSDTLTNYLYWDGMSVLVESVDANGDTVFYTDYDPELHGYKMYLFVCLIQNGNDANYKVSNIYRHQVNIPTFYNGGNLLETWNNMTQIKSASAFASKYATLISLGEGKYKIVYGVGLGVEGKSSVGPEHDTDGNAIFYKKRYPQIRSLDFTLSDTFTLDGFLDASEETITTLKEAALWLMGTPGNVNSLSQISEDPFAEATKKANQDPTPSYKKPFLPDIFVSKEDFTRYRAGYTYHDEYIYPKSRIVFDKFIVTPTGYNFVAENDAARRQLIQKNGANAVEGNYPRISVMSLDGIPDKYNGWLVLDYAGLNYYNPNFATELGFWGTSLAIGFGADNSFDDSLSPSEEKVFGEDISDKSTAAAADVYLYAGFSTYLIKGKYGSENQECYFIARLKLSGMSNGIPQSFPEDKWEYVTSFRIVFDNGTSSADQLKDFFYRVYRGYTTLVSVEGNVFCIWANYGSRWQIASVNADSIVVKNWIPPINDPSYIFSSRIGINPFYDASSKQFGYTNFDNDAIFTRGDRVWWAGVSTRITKDGLGKFEITSFDPEVNPVYGLINNPTGYTYITDEKYRQEGYDTLRNGVIPDTVRLVSDQSVIDDWAAYKTNIENAVANDEAYDNVNLAVHGSEVLCLVDPRNTPPNGVASSITVRVFASDVSDQTTYTTLENILGDLRKFYSQLLYADTSGSWYGVVITINANFTSGSATSAAVVATAQTTLGRPYVPNGKTMKGFDTTGVAIYSFTENGIPAGLTVDSVANLGTSVANATAAGAGGIVIWRQNGNIVEVALLDDQSNVYIAGGILGNTNVRKQAVSLYALGKSVEYRKVI